MHIRPIFHASQLFALPSLVLTVHILMAACLYTLTLGISYFPWLSSQRERVTAFDAALRRIAE